MKQFLGHILLTLTVVACSTDSSTFRLNGKFKNFNQGELFVYRLTGKSKLDTVRLVEGKYSYEVPMEDTAVLAVVFPNFSEIPVIAAPGTSVSMQGNASHLREVKVSGTDDNALLTQFRLDVNDMTPPQANEAAAKFIADHPTSPAARYVLDKFFLNKADAPYDKAAKLLATMKRAAPYSRPIASLQQRVATLQQSRVGRQLPAFKAVTIKGDTVSNASLKGQLNVITLYATWNYESRNTQRQLFKLKKKYGQRLQLLSICIDGNPSECREAAARDSLSWPIVCDGRLWESPIVKKLGFYAIPDAIITDKTGRMKARRLSGTALSDEIEKLLGNK